MKVLVLDTGMICRDGSAQAIYNDDQQVDGVMSFNMIFSWLITIENE